MKIRLSDIRCKILLTLVLTGIFTSVASAFPTDTYRGKSVLSEGRWLKVSVKETGIHFISIEQLKKWGFTDLDSVKIYGYGGRPLPDRLIQSEYADDLPQLPVFKSEKGLYFYAEGPVNFSLGDSGLYERTVNPYSNFGYYFISENADSQSCEIVKEGYAIRAANAPTQFLQPLLHETDKINYGSTGRVFLGEDFRITPSRAFEFNLTDRVNGSEIMVDCSFASTTTSASYLTLTANGNAIPDAERLVIPQTYGSNYGVLKSNRFSFTPTENKMVIGVSFVGGGIVKNANLDYLLVNYLMKGSVPKEGSVVFETTSQSADISNEVGSAHVWDVTNLLNPIELNVLDENGRIAWMSEYVGKRKYALWSENGKFPTPEAVEMIENQNLHDESIRPVMVIISVPALMPQAEKLARFHRETDGFEVLTVNQKLIFNEFSSGSPEPGAFRKFLKMLYDRSGGMLKYALFLGRGSYDNRMLSSHSYSHDNYLMPIWESEESMTETVSYTTDDLYSQLEDNAGLKPESDIYSIAVGRIPAVSTAEAELYIEKLNSYYSQSLDGGEWTSRVIMLADDGDNATHMIHAENETKAFQAAEHGKDKLYEKIYLDAYSLKGGVCEEAAEKLKQNIEKGALWWNYNGHANKYYLTGQSVLTLNDIDNLRNKKWPVFFGATCYFMQWDNNDRSGAEKLLFNGSGGIIAGITATRPVFISDNAFMAEKMAEEAFLVDGEGKYQPIGISLQNAKNKLASPASTSNGNKLRYGLMGDPALRLAGSLNKVQLDSVDSNAIPTEDKLIMSGRGKYMLKGRVTDSEGNLLTDFNGRINLSLFDADKSVTTKGRDIDGSKGTRFTYDIHGDLLFMGSDTINDGKWSIKVVVPEDIVDNFRPATLLFTALSSSGSASSVMRDIYVSGMVEEEYADTVAPVIERIYLNEPSFKSGDKVNSSPVLFVDMSDDTGINLSPIGLGKSMILTLDGKTVFNDVTMYYTPSSDGRAAGSVVYPLSELSEGRHTLQFRVSDLSGNITESEIYFTVDDNLAPEILDIYTDENPASANVNFYLVHNRPESLLTITVSVYSLAGNLVWSSTITDRSDLLVSSPVRWNLLDRGGRRVSRGIYIYRAEVECNGKRVLSPAKRLAVTGR